MAIIESFENWQKYCWTVGELREKLSQYPDDTIVVLEKDASGNGYSPLSNVEIAYYEPTCTYAGEYKVVREDWNAEDYFGDSWEEHVQNAMPAVILGPVN